MPPEKIWDNNGYWIFVHAGKKRLKISAQTCTKRRMLTICVKLLHKCFLIRLEKVDITCNTSYNMHINVWCISSSKFVKKPHYLIPKYSCRYINYDVLIQNSFIFFLCPVTYCFMYYLKGRPCTIRCRPFFVFYILECNFFYQHVHHRSIILILMSFSIVRLIKLNKQSSKLCVHQ